MGVPQASVLGPTLYQIYTADLSVNENVLVATFADDTAFLASHENPVEASWFLQEALDKTAKWAKKWKIEINANKSAHITFTTKHVKCSPAVNLYSEYLETNDCIKYLGLHRDKRLTWKDHIKKKRKQLNYKMKTMYWILGRKSKFTLAINYSCIRSPLFQFGYMRYNSGDVLRKVT